MSQDNPRINGQPEQGRKRNEISTQWSTPGLEQFQRSLKIKNNRVQQLLNKVLGPRGFLPTHLGLGVLGFLFARETKAWVKQIREES